MLARASLKIYSKNNKKERSLAFLQNVKIYRGSGEGRGNGQLPQKYSFFRVVSLNLRTLICPPNVVKRNPRANSTRSFGISGNTVSIRTAESSKEMNFWHLCWGESQRSRKREQGSWADRAGEEVIHSLLG